MRFWVCVTEGSATGVVHKHSCESCNDGKGILEGVVHIGGGWHGPYATRGAAIDAADALHKRPWECMKCMNSVSDNRVNAGA